jgi:hypothetical protein
MEGLLSRLLTFFTNGKTDELLRQGFSDNLIAAADTLGIGGIARMAALAARASRAARTWRLGQRRAWADAVGRKSREHSVRANGLLAKAGFRGSCGSPATATSDTLAREIKIREIQRSMRLETQKLGKAFGMGDCIHPDGKAPHAPMPAGRNYRKAYREALGATITSTVFKRLGLTGTAMRGLRIGVARPGRAPAAISIDDLARFFRAFSRPGRHGEAGDGPLPPPDVIVSVAPRISVMPCANSDCPDNRTLRKTVCALLLFCLFFFFFFFFLLCLFFSCSFFFSLI